MLLLAFATLFLKLEPNFAQQISGYGPVDVAELNPLTLSWNQVSQMLARKLEKKSVIFVLSFARFIFW